MPDFAFDAYLRRHAADIFHFLFSSDFACLLYFLFAFSIFMLAPDFFSPLLMPSPPLPPLFAVFGAPPRCFDAPADAMMLFLMFRYATALFDFHF